MEYIKIKSTYENTTMKEYRNSNEVLIAYRIEPNEGYVLHCKTLDNIEREEFTGEPTGKVNLGYTSSFVQVGYNYDFEKNPLELYAVPEDQIHKEF